MALSRPLALLFTLVASSDASLKVGQRAQSQALALSPEPQSSAGHYWPHARGKVGAYTTATYPGPRNLSASLAWSWHHPAGRFHTTVLGGNVIDGDGNIYLSAEDGIRKFNQQGTQLWHYRPEGPVTTAPSLFGNALFGSSQRGDAFALDIATGLPLWKRNVAPSTGPDTSYVEAHDGVVVLGMEEGKDPIQQGGNQRVVGLNTTDGSTLWEYRPDKVVWNVMGVFPGDGSVVVMDFSGGVHRLGLHSGELLWHTPPPAENKYSFSDGGVIVGPNGAAYSCSDAGSGGGEDGSKGTVRAYRISDGAVLWSRTMKYPCNSWPAVSPDGRTVIVTLASFAGTLDVHPSAVLSLDAATGETKWAWEAPRYSGYSAGDAEGFDIRTRLGIRQACVPGPWNGPTFDVAGAIYVGHMSGHIYRIFDKNGNGAIEDDEVDSFDALAGFLHSGASFAPGLMAMASCDSLFVFSA